MLGHTGLTLLPSGPWQAAQVMALALPASAEPSTRPAAETVLDIKTHIVSAANFFFILPDRYLDGIRATAMIEIQKTES